jgi:putative pyoverdin transport system ATP-binding/permease protein
MRKGLLLSLLREQAGNRTRKVVAAAIMAGALEGLTIVIIGLSLDDLREGSISLRNFVLFLMALGGYYYFYKYAIGNFTSVALGIVHGLQRRVTDAFRRLSLRQFEQLDEGQVYQEIIGNKDIIIESTRYLVIALSGGVLMLVAFMFALFLSPIGFLVIAASLGASGVLLMAMHKDVNVLQRRIMGMEQKLTLSLKDLLYGFTELKVNRAKRDELLDDVIHARAADSHALKQESEQLYVRGLAFFNSFIFVPVGAIIFILPGFVEISYDTLVKLIGVTLFSLGPLTSIITALPAMSKADLLIRNVLDFEERLQNMREEASETAVLPFEFEEIALRDCGFAYESADGSGPFSVHIEQFELQRNELVFITGGNGSGKTSFMKMFAGLYQPEHGSIQVNGHHVREVGIDAYRSLFSVVPMSFHLFEQLYGIEDVDLAYGDRLLAEMRLGGHASIVDGNRFSKTELSSGQRRRLAVIAALLEKRPVLLFDEVAADFDPIFRRFFYEEFLPGLKREGRTILAISHDDRFFHIADRIVTMRDGRIASVEQPGRVEA